MIPEPKPMPVERKHLLGETRSAVPEAICDSETGSAHPASPSRFYTCATNAGAMKPRPRRGRAANSGQRLQRSPFGVFNLFLDALAGSKPLSFGDSFCRWPWPCAVRTRPLFCRGYCDAGRRFIHYENRGY